MAGDSGAKREQARTRLARQAVIAAARVLFVEHGYGATTIEAISELANVPPATVYRLFASKLGILKGLLDTSIVGDDEIEPMADRPQVQQLLEEPDPRQQLAGFVALAADVNGRVGAIYRVLVSAASTDSEAAVLLDDLTQQRQQGQQLIARRLSRSGSLRPGLREREAADVIHALVSPELYRLTVVDRGWKPARYRQWLTGLLVDQLLPPAP